jgi:hypothetical protein
MRRMGADRQTITGLASLVRERRSGARNPCARSGPGLLPGPPCQAPSNLVRT